ncbi:MAG TPA: hypothetical protein PKN13_06270 [Accumulibacter sp.]|nr:hypothetical protein [Accumulibacter sp.]HMW17406.1 hypothetical protein [Accumulibacter sp.]HMX23430.1 hypothetical protein [Accumulibacter sp.]HNC17823.1 hypothetical protein [Accumulibacter sp.]HND80132.1 hypothetical protein [Accumulibacter sp.]
MTDQAPSSGPADGTALLAAGLCRGGRLLGSASLLLSGLAFGALAFGSAGFFSRSVWLSIALLGIPALYLTIRLAIDEPVFAYLADRPVDAVDFLSRFDTARQNLDLGAGKPASRTLIERARGVRRLFRMLRHLLILQWCLALVAGVLG